MGDVRAAVDCAVTRLNFAPGLAHRDGVIEFIGRR